MNVWRVVAKLGLAGLLAAGMAGMAGAAERHYELELETGLGYDSNAFLAPDKGFFDPFSATFVTPRRRSGVFFPVAAGGEIAIDLGRSQLEPSLLFSGRFYPGSDLEDADNYRLRLDADLEYLLRKRGVYRDRLIVTPAVLYSKEIYVDRETGLERVSTTTAESLADRFTYWRYGLEVELRVRSTPIRYALKARARSYDYEEVSVLDSLDQNYYLLGAEAEYDLVDGTTLKVGADFFVRDFDDRRSRDLEGDLVEGSDREYTYYDFELELEQEIGSDWELELAYSRLERDDEFRGYNDYTRNAYSVELRYRNREQRRLELEATYWDRNYPRAFAFDRPSAVVPETGRLIVFPRRDYRTWEVELRGEQPLSGVDVWGALWSLWSEYEYLDQESSDPRFDYRRHLVSAGIRMAL